MSSVSFQIVNIQTLNDTVGKCVITSLKKVVMNYNTIQYTPIFCIFFVFGPSKRSSIQADDTVRVVL